MKKCLFRALSVAVVAAAMLVTGCGKRTSTPSTSTLNGTYTVSTSPLYAKAAAIDPDAMAIDTEMNGEPLQLTDLSLAGQFGQVAAFALDRIELSGPTRGALALLACLLLLGLALDLRGRFPAWRRGLSGAAK